MEQKAISSDLIRGHIDTIILHTLLDGDKHAQQIIDTVEEKSNKQYQLNQATLYSSLKRLESAGYVKSYWFDSDGGRRKYIKITDKGIELVNDNLSNWSFSRAIIDKLINYEEPVQNNVVMTKNNTTNDLSHQESIQNASSSQKIVFIRQDDNNHTSPELQKSISGESKPLQQETMRRDSENKSFSTTPMWQNIAKTTTEQTNTKKNNIEYVPVAKLERNEKDYNEQKNDEDVKEVNFRTILSGLIQASESENQEIKALQKEELKPNVEAVPDAAPKQLKFNETISDENVIKREMKNYGGKIDFSDVVSNAEKEGFKVRVSTKNSSKPQGKVYSNKLLFFSSLLIFIFAVVEYFLLSSSVQGELLSSNIAVIFGVAAALFPITSGIIYTRNARKTMPKCVGGEKLLTGGIIVFNLLLISFALNFILGVDLYDKIKLTRYLLLPCLVSVDVLLFFIIEFVFSRLSFFKVKIKK